MQKETWNYLIIMGLEVDSHYEPNSTPKLSLSKLPCKLKEPIQMLTPPLHPSVSIPFQWEEAPGKPRATMDEAAAPPSAAAATPTTRSLELPPRLSHDGARITIMPSSPTVGSDRPYVGRSLSFACTFSSRKGPVSRREDGLKPMKKGCCGNSGPRRWGSFKGEEKLGKGTFDFSQSLGEIFMSDKNLKATRLRRVRSFFNLSSMNSNLLDIYASFKEAVSWRRRR